MAIFCSLECNQHVAHSLILPFNIFVCTYVHMLTVHSNCILQGNQAILRTAYVTCWHYIFIITWCMGVELTQFPLNVRNHICKRWNKQTMEIWIKRERLRQTEREREKLKSENTQTILCSHSKIGSQSSSLTHTHTHTCLLVWSPPPTSLILLVKKKKKDKKRETGRRKWGKGREGKREEYNGIMSIGVDNWMLERFSPSLCCPINTAAPMGANLY